MVNVIAPRDIGMIKAVMFAPNVLRMQHVMTGKHLNAKLDIIKMASLVCGALIQVNTKDMGHLMSGQRQ